MAATTSYENRHCPGKSVSQLWVQQTIKLVLVWLDFPWIEQVLKFTLQKAAQGWQQIVPMLFLPDTWETSQQGWVQGTHQGPTSKFNVISAFLFVCLFVWSQRRYRATSPLPYPSPPLLIIFQMLECPNPPLLTFAAMNNEPIEKAVPIL